MKFNKNLEEGDSSSDEDVYDKPRLNSEAEVLKEKNRILMEKLFKSLVFDVHIS